MDRLLPDRLETSRLVLRKPRPEDAAIIFETYCQDAEVVRYLMWRPHPNVEVTETFIADCLAGWKEGSRFSYMLTMRGREDRPIGMLEARVSGHQVGIGYVLERGQWGQGLMPEAVRALVDVALAIPGIYRLEATCYVDNLASARTLEKAGFVREGRLERFMIHPNLSSEPSACYLYSRCK